MKVRELMTKSGVETLQAIYERRRAVHQPEAA